MEEQSRCAEFPVFQTWKCRSDTGSQNRNIVYRIMEERSKRHKIDPRVSLAALLLVNVMAFATPLYGVIIAAVALDFALLLWCGRSKLALSWVIGYLVVCLVFCACMAAGPSLAPVGACFLYISKMFPAAMLASAMISTTYTGELAWALQTLGVPSRVTVATCVALRFFPTIAREARSVSDAMKLRNERLTVLSAIRHPEALFESFIVPFINRISIVADELGDAVMSRGGDTSRRRTSLYKAKLGLSDAVLVSAVVVLLAVALAGRLL